MCKPSTSMNTLSNCGSCGNKCGSNSACVKSKCTCKPDYIQDPLSANCVKPCGGKPCHAPYKCVDNVCTANGYGVYNPYSSPKCKLDTLPSSYAQCMMAAPKQSMICSRFPQTCRPFVGEQQPKTVSLIGSACNGQNQTTTTITGTLYITAPVGDRIHNITFYAAVDSPIEAILTYNEDNSVLNKNGMGFSHKHAIDFTIPFSQSLYANVKMIDQFKNEFNNFYDLKSDPWSLGTCDTISSSE